MLEKDADKVSFTFNVEVQLNDLERLGHFINSLFEQNSLILDKLNYTFCSDEEILEVNKSYLNHDYSTDIITFDLRDRPSEPIYGEIFISKDTVASNALLNQQSFDSELHRVIFHGVLHLIGFNDKTEEDMLIMRNEEEKALGSYFS